MSHAYNCLFYHFVWSTKYRNFCITEPIKQKLYPVMQAKISELGGGLLALGGVENHVHVLVKLDGSLAAADFVKAVKINASRYFNQLNPENYVFSWQEGYSVFSVSPSAVYRVMRYIHNQEEHHKTCSFDDEMAELGKQVKFILKSTVP